MIVWINGAFGAGKSTIAGLVTKKLNGARLFDPEYVGYMLTPFVELPTGDFQDLKIWRHLVIETMSSLVHRYPHPWVAPMSLINPAYRAEILDGIRSREVELHEFVLAVPEDQLRARIDADQVDTRARQWRHDHAGQALATFAALNDATFIDATHTPETVAEAVASQLRPDPPARAPTPRPPPALFPGSVGRVSAKTTARILVARATQTRPS